MTKDRVSGRSESTSTDSAEQSGTLLCVIAGCQQPIRPHTARHRPIANCEGRPHTPIIAAFALCGEMYAAS